MLVFVEYMVKVTIQKTCTTVEDRRNWNENNVKEMERIECMKEREKNRQIHVFGWTIFFSFGAETKTKRSENEERKKEHQ